MGVESFVLDEAEVNHLLFDRVVESSPLFGETKPDDPWPSPVGKGSCRSGVTCAALKSGRSKGFVQQLALLL